MVRWKAVSKQATCGRPGAFSSAARIGARLCGWCSGASGREPLEFLQQRRRDALRPVMRRAAMDDAVPEPRQRPAASRSRSQGSSSHQCLGRALRGRPGQVGARDRGAGGILRPEARADADAVHLAIEEAVVAIEQREFQRGGAGIHHPDHAGHVAHACGSCWAAAESRRASATEARREVTLSARLVRMMGTRAPRTMPALSAPAR